MGDPCFDSILLMRYRFPIIFCALLLIGCFLISCAYAPNNMAVSQSPQYSNPEYRHDIYWSNTFKGLSDPPTMEQIKQYDVIMQKMKDVKRFTNMSDTR